MAKAIAICKYAECGAEFEIEKIVSIDVNYDTITQ